LIGVGAPKVQLMVRVDNHQPTEFYRQLGYGTQDVLVLGRRLD
jgi:ribosomal protein S18 acetylase RimI-like enzyme